MYYGQFDDDRLIEEYFKDGYIGGCIDVGATDGVTINNTMHFEENNWYCLCIEPNSNSYALLENNRKNTLNLAISNFNKDLVNFTVVNLNSGSNEDEGAISSLSIDNKLMQDHIEMGFNVTTKDIQVSVRTLDYCIENYYKHNKIDFLDIDTEGTELDVLKGFNINKWQPKLMVIENNYNTNVIEVYLKQFNYIKDKRVGVNDYYIKYVKKNFLIGPKLGDFLHSLYVVKCLSNGFKSDVYIRETENDIFSRGIKNTYKDIYSVIKQQPYIDNFLLYDNKKEDYININFKNFDYLYKTTWYDIYQKLFKISDIEPWLFNIDEKIYENSVVIHISDRRYNENFNNLLKNIISNNKCIFISTNEDEYENFQFKDILDFKKCSTFSELYSIIQDCKFFVGNQSMPLAIAHGLFKPHIGLLHGLDAIHYKDKINKDYFWFDDQKNISKNFHDISNFIKLDNIEFNSKINIIENLIFNIYCDKFENKTYISCNSTISVYIILYDYNIVNNEKVLIYSTLTNFDANDQYWYTSDSKEFKDLTYLKIEIRYNEMLLKEEIIKIE